MADAALHRHFEDAADAPAQVASTSGLKLDANHVRVLKARDNVTNWLHLARVWLIIALTVVTVIAVEGLIQAYGLSVWWNTPAWLVAILVIGASQHQLGGAVHEGTHFLLFENRKLNELASDWLAAFALYTSTYQFRVHHLAHHQFVNDPARDPDISQLKESGHWLDFPIEHIDVLSRLAKQLWLPNLIRFTLVRARYSALGHEDNPYLAKDAPRSPWPVRVGILFAVAVPCLVTYILPAAGGHAALALLVGAFALVAAYYVWLPDERFPQTRLKPLISHRTTTLSRMGFLFVVYLALTLHDARTGTVWAWSHFGLFWVAPLFTSFPLFMMIRQWVQHGNADRGRYTNTRVFLAGPLARYAIFPWGMDYHLPHHMLASVPHYRLKDLHELLQADPEYREKGVVVEGCFGHGHIETGRPTAFSVLTRAHAPGHGEAVYVDNAALEYADVNDAAAIAREAARSAGEPNS